MQQTIYRLYSGTPLDVLKDICRRNKIKFSGKNKLELANAIVENMNNPAVVQEVDEIIYAGRRAVSWFVIDDTKNRQKTTANIVKKTLERKLNPSLFKTVLNPTLTEKPQIILSKVYSKNKIMCLFAHSEIRPAYIDYEVKELKYTMYTSSFIRISSMCFEIRTNPFEAMSIAEHLCMLLDSGPAECITLTENDLDQFINKINGHLHAVKKKHTSGDYDTTEIVAAPTTPDLRNSQQFLKNGLSKLPTRNEVISFPFRYNDSDEVLITISVNPVTGSFWFRSYVREQVIDYIFNSLKQIKGF